VVRDRVTLLMPVGRRDLLKWGGVAALWLASGGHLGRVGTPVAAQTLSRVSMQIGWFLNSQMAGDVVAISKGFFRDAGLDVAIRPGGPAIDPIQVVAGGTTTFGNVASVAVLVNARSQGVPVKAFATAFQRHPFAFIFFTRSGIRTPKDFEGKTIGIQPTARPLLELVISKYGLDRDRVKVTFVGGETTPLVTGQVDVITGWVINAAQMETAERAGNISYFRLWDLGIRLYAYTYFATDQVLQERREVLSRFLAASARGWLYARDNPQEAVEAVLRMTTGLDRDLEFKTWERVIRGGYLTSVTTKQWGWGAMEPRFWKDLTEAMYRLGQVPRPVRVDEIMTNEIVEMARTPRV
jgi:NitT/TauT family transport system substrate-binding protein